MKSLKQDYYNRIFSHIYIEKAVMGHPRAKQIINHFPDAVFVEIDHYKDIFCRRGQNFNAQHQAPALILAAKQGTLCYPGASVCQSFGNEHFYYTSCVMNCIFDCEYCYLRGMYPSGNLVIFVNLEDIFAEVGRILAEHPMYLCVSYDTDLIALENVTGFVKEWVDFARQHKNLRLEIRTKCGRIDLWEQLLPSTDVIFAFTLSPDSVVKQYEHHTSSLKMRIASAAKALEKGFSVRLCFDPMIYCADWKKQYGEMIEQVVERLDMKKLNDVSIGSFRISKEYLKKMRRTAPNSAVVQFPFENEHGVYHYPAKLMQDMENYLCHQLQVYLPEEKIFRWEQE